MIIQHNIPAMNSYRNLNNNQNAIAGNLEKLSSGYQINRAGDNAAGLAVSEKMRSQITGLDAAQNNVADGISLVKTAEGALQEVHDMLNRMTELATLSANGTFDDEVDRAAYQQEVEQLIEEIDRISDSTNFNGINLLDGSLDSAKEAYTYSIGVADVQDATGTKTTAVTAGTYYLTEFSADDLGLDLASITSSTTSVTIQIGQTDEDGVYTSDTVTLDFSSNATDASSTDEQRIAAAMTAINKALSADISNGDGFDASYDADTGIITFKSQVEGSAMGDIALTGDAAYDKGDTLISGNTYAKEFEAGAKIEFNGVTTGQTMTIDGVTIHFTDKLGDEDANNHVEDGNTIYVELYHNDGGTQGEALSNEELAQAVADAMIAHGNNGNWTSDNVLVSGASIEVTGFTEEAGSPLQLQIGDTSDSYNQLTVDIQSMHTTNLGTWSESGALKSSIADIDISNQDGATAAIDVIKDAINQVSTNRAGLGAIQNRLEHTANNLSVQEENIQDAESTIRDTDVAAEMMEYTKNNILIQSAQSMLAQANQLPQGVLQLLG